MLCPDVVGVTNSCDLIVEKNIYFFEAITVYWNLCHKFQYPVIANFSIIGCRFLCSSVGSAVPVQYAMFVLSSTLWFFLKRLFFMQNYQHRSFFFLIFHEKCYKSLRTVPTGVYVVETLLYLISTHAEETLESCFVNLYQHCFSLFCHTELTHGR